MPQSKSALPWTIPAAAGGFFRFPRAVAAAFILVALTAAEARGYSGERYFFDNAIQLPGGQAGASITRWTLRPAELNAPMNFCVTLKMRNLVELEARLGRGEKISPAEMEANYLPAASDYTAVKDWLVSQGFTVTRPDPNHTNVFVRGTVDQIEHRLDAAFARIATADGEFTSAITVPSLPVEFSASVLGFAGLQPHIRMHAHSSSAGARPQTVNVGGGQYFAPSDVLAAYSTSGTLNGAGQTIAIVIDGTVATSDLQVFYSTVGSSQVASNVTTILVNGGPTSSTDNDEATLDVEWASTIAPGAKVRLYAMPDLSDVSITTALNQIIADAAANNITVLAMSLGAPEGQDAPSRNSLMAFSQNFAQVAAANITTLASSGDGGSNPNPLSPGNYGTSYPLAAEYPASDPNVTGVGGTRLTVTSSSFYVTESVFSTISSGVASSRFASGGGVSGVFSRPSWQTDGGSVLASNSMRCVPDVAINWEAFTSTSAEPALIILNGAPQGVGGTSLSCQIWAGVVALVNQARANAGKGPIGLLGPAIYPLHTTSSFNDVMTGNNGAYNAAFGYDLCTGLGSPNITNLTNALSGAQSSQGGSTPPPSPAPSGGGGGGGGGSPSLWFYGALALLVALNRMAWARPRAT